MSGTKFGGVALSEYIQTFKGTKEEGTFTNPSATIGGAGVAIDVKGSSTLLHECAVACDCTADGVVETR